MDPAEFVSIVRRHERFVKGQSGGQRANLKDVDLSGLRLPGINLQSALLAGLNLKKRVSSVVVISASPISFAPIWKILKAKRRIFSARICVALNCMARIYEARTFRKWTCAQVL